ncbi:MAG: hypothetical protein WKF60_09205 [Ilumatobacter sp.]
MAVGAAGSLACSTGAADAAVGAAGSLACSTGAADAAVGAAGSLVGAAGWLAGADGSLVAVLAARASALLDAATGCCASASAGWIATALNPSTTAISATSHFAVA